MAAQNDVMLENHLKLFVETKVGEPVSLEFSTRRICIKADKKTGSTTLGAFWARVIQSYFPAPQFTYQKSYCRSQGSETLTTVVDGSTITIYLRNGLLRFDADVIWFKIIFRKIMEHYDQSTYSSSLDYLREQCVLDARKEIQRKERERLDGGIIQPERVDETLALVSSDIQIPELKSRFNDEVEETIYKQSHSLQPSTQLFATDMSASSGDSCISLRDGSTYVYPMWKQLLNKWLGTEGCRVYICSRHVDVDRVKIITGMSYKYRLNTTGLEAIYTDVVTNSGQKMAAVKDALMCGLTANEKLFIEYRIINKIIYGATKSISSNFIAGLHSNGIVELMVTSACFDSEGFDKSSNLHTVVITKMSQHYFQSAFLDKLATI